MSIWVGKNAKEYVMDGFVAVGSFLNAVEIFLFAVKSFLFGVGNFLLGVVKV
jgi:hypothetical protein